MAEKAWVKITDEDREADKAGQIYEQVSAARGSGFNMEQAAYVWPGLNDIQEREFELFFAGTHTALGCDIKDLVAVLVSQLNNSDYCDGWFRAALELRGWSDEKITHIMQDIESGHLDPAGRAVLVLADKIVRRPQSIDPVDIAAARAAGLSDRCIIEVAALTGYLDHMTRLANVLGVMND
ncbi:MAG: hypothetical protein Q8L35_07425 [Actinomycetota bacterium]|nr:hypothetical protein [Actinomycetota bacterium]